MCRTIAAQANPNLSLCQSPPPGLNSANAALNLEDYAANVRLNLYVRRLRGTCSEIGLRYTPDMATITEVEKLAFDLPDSDRAVLASHLLRSLPSVLHDEDEGIGEALRRDAELDANPGSGITLEQLDQRIRDRRH